jgi:ABC-type antimicrobial peptide transport system permease subunit
VKDFEVLSRVANLKRNEANNKMYDMTFMICGIISLLVGGIVVMNIQLASFKERVREVGTRKAVGASPAQIFVQFLSESVLVSIFGGFLGLFVGRLFTQGITSLIKQPAIVTPSTLINAMIFAAGTGLVFGMYPAIRASRLNPIEALRTE